MKNAKVCLKCEHPEIWRIDPVCSIDYQSSNVIVPLPVAVRIVENPDAGLLARPTKRVEVGAFVAYVCAGCGYSELYARDLEGIAALREGHEGSRVSRAGTKPKALTRA
jgi:predicted nucleic-acid-binding Zn-ribbon protein